jgi:4-amino-4-deoxy-L-arabinose transferase-like glycosyltransferase|tara:strand:- start:824 stop:2059 length:1236 start_codon:yes stop_codon:yes gene_type:complete
MQQQAYQRFPTKTYDLFQKYALWIPALLFICTYILVYLKWEINISSGDAKAYIDGARRLLADIPLVDGRSKRSIGYELIIALNYWLKFGNTGVIISQVIINALATVAIYDLGRRLSGKATGILAASFYVANPDVVQWTFIMMTESIFTAGLILSCWAFYRIQMNPNSIWKLTLVAILWVYAAVIRANGWFMLPLFGMFLIIDLLNKRSFKLATYFFFILTLLGAFAIWGPFFVGVAQDNPARLTLGALANYYNFLINGVVISHSGAVMNHSIDTFIQMPIADIQAEPGLVSYLSYCLKHPYDSINLFLHRIFYATVYSRPDYSTMHNLIINSGIPLIYLFAFIGIIKKKREPVTRLILFIVVVQLLIISVTVVLYDIRFWVYVFPLITMYSAIGVIASIKLLFHNIHYIYL